MQVLGTRMCTQHFLTKNTVRSIVGKIRLNTIPHLGTTRTCTDNIFLTANNTALKILHVFLY